MVKWRHVQHDVPLDVASLRWRNQLLFQVWYIPRRTKTNQRERERDKIWGILFRIPSNGPSFWQENKIKSIDFKIPQFDFRTDVFQSIFSILITRVIAMFEQHHFHIMSLNQNSPGRADLAILSLTAWSTSTRCFEFECLGGRTTRETMGKRGPSWNSKELWNV